MTKWIENIKRKLNLVKIKREPTRYVPLGPISKENYKYNTYSLEELYGKNLFVTSRYNWYSFFFKNLYEQFQRIANFYFLCLAIIQLFTDAPVSPAISILPLTVVISATMIKQGYEDYQRHIADNELNNAKVEIISKTGNLKTIRSCEITVGDIVYCKNNHLFPCDLVLLTSSEESGNCYVTTANLDGETNLKYFRGVLEEKDIERPQDIASNLSGTITCEEPIADLYSFTGKISYTNAKVMKAPKIVSLSAENVLLRGARLKNTDYVYAVAIYTGQDTKMSLNSQGKRLKSSRVEQKLNIVLIFIMVFLVLVSLLFTIAKSTLEISNNWYITLVQNKNSAWPFIQDFLGHIVLFNYIIPISLYVTIEMVKFISAIFFNHDIQLYDPEINEPAKANTSDILEDIGQIEYLFSDKTGTLTENLMVFRRFSIGKEAYLFEKGLFIDNLNPQIMKLPRYVVAFITVLSLCHTVRVEMPSSDVFAMNEFSVSESSKKSSNKKKLVIGKKKVIGRGQSRIRRESAIKKADEVTKKGFNIANRDFEKYVYQASSPDEKAFVEAAREFHIIYHGEDSRGFRIVTIVNDRTYKYRVLEILEFDSDRKCMTIVLQNVHNENPDINSQELDKQEPVLILTKGADTAMLDRISMEDNHMKVSYSNDPIIKDFFTHDLEWTNDVDGFNKIIEDFASLGLRTLVIGGRLVTSDEWLSMSNNLKEARLHLENRQEMVNQAMRLIESELVIFGCTGIEDKLQDKVHETITDLRCAGVKVWVLTGDKEETATNISYSTGHFDDTLKKIHLTKIKNESEFLTGLTTALRQMKSTDNYGLILDGQSLKFGLYPQFRNDLMQLAVKSKAVLGCRLTPAQKADIVRLIKGSRSPSPITAAIGDGANDVSMILEAHVGFGLFGKEGRQAVRSADYAFARFKFLRRILFVHGFTFYIRITTMIKYFFYKNMVFTLSLMLYSFFNLFSSQTLFSEIYLLFYNLTMTALPIILFGIFEKPKSDKMLQDYPILYSTIRSNAGFSIFNILGWIILAFYHSGVSFYGTYLLINSGDTNLPISNLTAYGSYIILCIFFIVTFKLMLNSNSWNVMFISSIVFTLVMNMIMFVFNNSLYLSVDPHASLLGVYDEIFTGFGCASHYLGFIIILTIALLPDFLMRVYSDYIWSKDIEKVKDKTPVLQLMKISQNIKKQYLSSSVGLHNLKNILKTLKPMNLSASTNIKVETADENNENFKYLPPINENLNPSECDIYEQESEEEGSLTANECVTHFNLKFRKESPVQIYRA